MRRICFCLLLALTSAGVGAREVSLASPNGGDCGDHASASHKAEPPEPKAAPEKPSVKPSVHSDAPGRLGSLRWHSFLPGMFR